MRRIQHHLRLRSRNHASFGTKVSFESWNGGETAVVPTTSDQATVLDLARAAGVQLEGACEGSISCSTCHVIVNDDAAFAALPPPCEDELDMLDVAFSVTPTSRLGCCLVASRAAAASPGGVLRVRLPPATMDFEQANLAATTVSATSDGERKSSGVQSNANPVDGEVGGDGEISSTFFSPAAATLHDDDGPINHQSALPPPSLFPRPSSLEGLSSMGGKKTLTRVEVMVEHTEDPGMSDVGAHAALLRSVGLKLGVVTEADGINHHHHHQASSNNGNKTKTTRRRFLHEPIPVSSPLASSSSLGASFAAPLRLHDLAVVRKSLDARRSRHSGNGGGGSISGSSGSGNSSRMSGTRGQNKGAAAAGRGRQVEGGGPRFNYVVDVSLPDAAAPVSSPTPLTQKQLQKQRKQKEKKEKKEKEKLAAKKQKQKQQPSSSPQSLPLPLPATPPSPDTILVPHEPEPSPSEDFSFQEQDQRRTRRAGVVVVGAGPAGLFAALRLGEAFARERARRKSGGDGGGNSSYDNDDDGCDHLRVTLLERGQAVDRRGADIGNMYIHKALDPESNMLFGMGGAGTWSDGKLTTRIGHNSDDVRAVLGALVGLGAPPAILAQGKPHLGTDRMVAVLRSMQKALDALGPSVEVRFGSKVKSVQVESGKVTGVVLSSSSSSSSSSSNSHADDDDDELFFPAEAVLLAPGHSSRDLYERLHAEGKVQLAFQPFSVGLRAEHPQELVNRAQYGVELASLASHKGKLPVADYHLVAKKEPEEGRGSGGGGGGGGSTRREREGRGAGGVDRRGRGRIGGRGGRGSGGGQGRARSGHVTIGNRWDYDHDHDENANHSAGGATNPNPTTSTTITTPISSASSNRAMYSFCMCPGGQVVPTALRSDELCVNGMSFSKRASKFANSGVVVPVTLDDCAAFVDQTPLVITTSAVAAAAAAHRGPSSSSKEEVEAEAAAVAAEEEEALMSHDSMVLAGLSFQRAMEKEAALRGGGKGDLTAPVQTIQDFLALRTPTHGIANLTAGDGGGGGGGTSGSRPLPASSYRPGVRSASLHDLYPPAVSAALARGLEAFGDPSHGGLEGYTGPQGLLHGVETRTSAPVRIVREAGSLQSPTAAGLFPLGEGAGYAGGIMSAAVDGTRAAKVLLRELGIEDGFDSPVWSSSSSSGGGMHGRSRAR